MAILPRPFEAEQGKLSQRRRGQKPVLKFGGLTLPFLQSRNVFPGKGAEVQHPGTVHLQQFPRWIEKRQGFPLGLTTPGMAAGDSVPDAMPVVRSVEAGRVQDCLSLLRHTSPAPLTSARQPGCGNGYRSSLGSVKVTSSSTPVSTLTRSGFRARTTLSTSTSGVEAPDVIPTLSIPSSHAGSISSGPLIR